MREDRDGVLSLGCKLDEIERRGGKRVMGRKWGRGEDGESD